MTPPVRRSLPPTIVLAAAGMVLLLGSLALPWLRESFSAALGGDTRGFALDPIWAVVRVVLVIGAVSVLVKWSRGEAERDAVVRALGLLAFFTALKPARLVMLLSGASLGFQQIAPGLILSFVGSVLIGVAAVLFHREGAASQAPGVAGPVAGAPIFATPASLAAMRGPLPPATLEAWSRPFSPGMGRVAVAAAGSPDLIPADHPARCGAGAATAPVGVQQGPYGASPAPAHAAPQPGPYGAPAPAAPQPGPYGAPAHAAAQPSPYGAFAQPAALTATANTPAPPLVAPGPPLMGPPVPAGPPKGMPGPLPYVMPVGPAHAPGPQAAPAPHVPMPVAPQSAGAYGDEGPSRLEAAFTQEDPLAPKRAAPAPHVAFVPPPTRPAHAPPEPAHHAPPVHPAHHTPPAHAPAPPPHAHPAQHLAPPHGHGTPPQAVPAPPHPAAPRREGSIAPPGFS